MSTKAQEKVQGIPHGIFHLTTFCHVQIYGLFKVLEGVVSREESFSLAHFFYKHLVNSAPWRAIPAAGLFEDGHDLNSCGNPRRKPVLNTAKMAQSVVGTEAWDPFLDAAGHNGVSLRALEGLPHYSPCLNISLILCLFSAYPRIHPST